MSPRSEPTFDAATALSIGRRDHQEDALVADFPVTEDTGVVVLADGMGGHAAGGLASRVAVSEVFAELLFRRAEPLVFAEDIPGALRTAAIIANHAILAEAERTPNLVGMGATLVVPVFHPKGLYWVSVGDSPLWLFRGGKLLQLNEDHSLAPQIELMVQRGEMTPDDAAAHPDRNCLTSALGAPEIPRLDCPDKPFALQDGDIVIAASDGLQVLSAAEITEILEKKAPRPAEEIARALLTAAEDVGDPEQDNTSLAVVRIRTPAKRPAGLSRSRRKGATRPLTARIEAAMRAMSTGIAARHEAPSALQSPRLP